MTLAAKVPRTYALCTEGNLRIDASQLVLPVKCPGATGAADDQAQDGIWRFAWPVDPSRTLIVPHTVAFARCVLEEWAQNEGLDFVPAQVHIAASAE